MRIAHREGMASFRRAFATSRARIGLLCIRGFKDLLTRPQFLLAARMAAALSVLVWVGWRLFQDWNAVNFPALTPSILAALGVLATGTAGLMALLLLFVTEPHRSETDRKYDST